MVCCSTNYTLSKHLAEKTSNFLPFEKKFIGFTRQWEDVMLQRRRPWSFVLSSFDRTLLKAWCQTTCDNLPFTFFLISWCASCCIFQHPVLESWHVLFNAIIRKKCSYWNYSVVCCSLSKCQANNLRKRLLIIRREAAGLAFSKLRLCFGQFAWCLGTR